MINTFVSNGYTGAIGVDFQTKAIEIDGKKVNLQIWDSAGQERYKSINQSLYRGANSIFLVYDANSRQSFEAIRGFKNDADLQSPKDFKIYLIAEQSHSETPEVSAQEGQALADEWGIPFHQCSTERNHNVEAPFMQAAGDFMSKQQIESNKSQCKMM